MDKWLGKYADFLYALLRIIVGVLFACHGSQKLFGLPVGQKQEATLLIVAGVIELVGGILIALGFLASWAAFIASGEMAAAYFKQHAPRGFWPIMQGGNGGELAILYCVVFLYIAARGSGILSVDALLGRSKRP
jgi:putative oxidoreductase